MVAVLRESIVLDGGEKGNVDVRGKKVDDAFRRGWVGQRDKPRLPGCHHVPVGDNDKDINLDLDLRWSMLKPSIMGTKRRRSSANSDLIRPISKKARTVHPDDHLSALSSELLIRILHLLPINTLLQCQLLSHRFYTLAGDSQIWKNLYYTRFVLPRALRIPGIKTTSAQKDDRLHFSSRTSKWLDEDVLVNGKGGKTTNWKKQYKLRHNWSIGACEMQEIHVADRPSVPEMLVRLAEGVVVTADIEDGLRAWDLKERALIAICALEDDAVPTCLAVDEQDGENGLGIAVGFVDGGWATWRLDIQGRAFTKAYRHPPSSNGRLGAVAYAHPYILTITDAQLLSLYTFNPKLASLNTDASEGPSSSPTLESETQIPQTDTDKSSPQTSTSPTKPVYPTLLASLKSHTSWPPLSLSIRTTSTTLIASIAYSLPTYLSGYTVGLQELHLSLSTWLTTFSRLASSLPQGFSSLLSSPSNSGTSSPSPDTSNPNPNPGPGPGFTLGALSGPNTRPTTLSYAHPYILATHPDNTLTLYLCVSNRANLSISPGTKLWGHTSSVSSAEITPRGKAVSVSTRGNELRVWELEGGVPSGGARRRLAAARTGWVDQSVRIRPELRQGVEVDGGGGGGGGGGGERDMGRAETGAEKDVFADEVEARKQWVGFDDEVVIVLKESGRGTQALMIYDFT